LRAEGALSRQRRGGEAHGVVTRSAALRDPDLAGFVAESISFPNTMVDRIAPAARFIARLWTEDLAPTAPPVPGVDFTHDTEELASRRRNPNIRRLTWRIAPPAEPCVNIC
jgi:mannitol-1-phosphate/altronate dehydrogenase